MDPVCHSLVGACLAQSGLKHRTGLGLATLVVAANVPDVDILAAFIGRNFEIRRGWTHGLLALAVWPWLLAGLVTLWARVRPSEVRPPTRFGQLVLLAFIGVATHPALDFLNDYGMRWLMPWRDRWYYGDALFIVDPWLWLVLGTAVWWTMAREHRLRVDPARPARIALAVSVVYVGLLMTTTLGARAAVARAVSPGTRFMAAAKPIDPLTKQIIIDDGPSYRLGTYRFAREPALQLPIEVSKGADLIAPGDLDDVADGPAFLRWARFPAARQVQSGDSAVIRVYDIRYSDGTAASWASLDVPTERAW